jgi:carbon-monoxide dehydrogenase medium subunit
MQQIVFSCCTPPDFFFPYLYVIRQEDVLKKFDYIRPETLEEAGRYLTQGKNVKILGGGATLFLQIQNDEQLPDIVMDVKALPGFHDVRYHHNHGLKLGAAVNLQHLATGLEIRRHYPILHQAAQKLASPQIRNRATVGGTLAWASPVSELAAPMLCYDAVCHTWRPEGARTIPVSELYLGDFKTALAADELITHVHLPSFPARTYGVYLRQTVRHDGRRMIAGLAALAIRRHNNLTNWRIAVLGVDDRPKRITEAEELLEGAPDEAAIAQALEAVQANIHPEDVVYARADYRRAVLNALLQRSIHSIIENLQE